MSAPAAPQGPSPPPLGQPPPYHLTALDAAADDSLPSYDDATNASTSPLLVGPQANYGTWPAYVDHDAASLSGSSEVEETTRAFPEWVGQALVVLCFIGILYGFWKLVNDSDNLAG